MTTMDRPEKHTILLRGDSPQDVKTAGEILRRGGLVAIPTETVYGLAANALDGAAVKAIYQAKGRPSDNPLIVHICDLSQLPPLVRQLPESAKKLAAAFWPGPLTIILKKSDLVPRETSGGLDTVAVRFPAHPVAQAVIREAGLPLAAPSANLSGKPSPTTFAHVREDLTGRVDALLDGGDCAVGVESTVLTLAEGTPRVLRPGGVTVGQLREVLGEVEVDPAVVHRLEEGAKAASPGMKYKHYAPQANVVILDASPEAYRNYVNRQPEAWARLGMAFRALLLAWLLWRLVESRCGLWQRDWSRRRRWLVGIGVHVLIGAWGLCLWKLPFLDHVLPKAVPQSVSGFSHPYLFPPQDSTWSDFPNRAFPHGMRQLGDNDAAPVRFLLIGDSHAWHLCEGLHRACAAKGNLRGVYLDAALLPAWNCRISFLQGSAVWGREQGEGLLRWVAAHPEFEVVVVSVHWWLRLQPEPIRDWQGNPIPPEQFQAAVEAGLEETCRRLQALGRRVVLLLDTPKYVEGDPFEGVLMRTIFHQPMPWVGVSAQQHAHNTATERAMIARICAAVPGVQQYDLAEPLLIGGAYPFLDEQGRFLYRDTNHVSTHGSWRVSYPLLEFLLPLMTPEQAPLQKK